MLQLTVFLPVIVMFFIPTIRKNFKTIHLGKVVVIVPLVLFGYFLSQLKNIYSGGIVYKSLAFATNVGLDINFKLDGLSLLFTLLITGIGTLVILYSCYYMDINDPKLHKFYIFLLIFMSAMLGVVLSDNLLSMYMFWELTSVSSFLLISYWHENDASRKGALKSLIITVFGGVLMLLGIFILNNVTGSFNISEIITFSQNNKYTSKYIPAMILILFGAFTKSAQFPFHIWLPDAMAAPTPISSYLHSATMVKAGIYLLLRVGIIFSFSASFGNILIIFGTLTMLIGSISAIFLKDLKGILAYSTISQLGMMTLMIGIANLGLYDKNHYIYTFAFYAVCFHIINHAAFKACLFMITGIIDHTFHTRDVNKLRGIRAYLPISFILSIIAGFSMAGIPPLSGFFSKEYFLTSVYGLISTSSLYIIIAILVVIASLGTFIYSFILIFKPFLGTFNKTFSNETKIHLPDKKITVAPVILAVFVIINSFIKDYIIIPAQNAALAGDVTNNKIISHISHDNFLSKELITTILVVLIGIFIYKTFAAKNIIYKYNPSIISIHRLYNSLGTKLHAGAGYLHNKFITNELKRNMSYIFLSLSITILAGYVAVGKPIIINSFSSVHIMNIIIGICIVICCIAMARCYNRLVLIILSSGVSFMMTALYVTFRAPDLAMTQFVIESISTIIFLIAFILLTNKTKHVEKQKFKLTNAIIAGLTGISFITVGLVSYAYKNPSAISQFYFDNVVSSGGGNIVNVIIVDFRGFDTLFEITVMTMVALIIYAMFKIIKRGGNKDEN
ncbi:MULTISPECIES: hydrogen gas-evolving membrane-bound hydrogenase subunit E [Gemella]|uniref:hydrogen gas-evolving membrane-bound hydrogenase subunit E n=1 Tax=Gemella TaxID=1378 RepID=UPI0007682834|nr:MULTISPECIES: hydrogen gas-evolving membrane-bound hydrogenase subunit E [Gemella]AME09914.1 sodium:proton antiporter [Gemella sp. oral taxon 928]AXI26052.1 sodium:proton antiporter [Gemella sp. ND 6198]